MLESYPMFKKPKFLLVAIALLLTAFVPRFKQRTVWMMGDSTMAIKERNKFPETGWGVPFATLFKKDIRVENRAKNGRSTRSFIDEGRWKEIYDHLNAGDYLFIQFGHNDEKTNKPKVGTSLAAYKANLAMFIDKAREKNAIPVLLTPIVRRHFENGTLVDTHKGYPEAMRVVADSLQVPIIDLTLKTTELLEGMGEKKSMDLFLHLKPGHENYPEGVEDNTHLNMEGAQAVADLVAQGLKESQLALAEDLK